MQAILTFCTENKYLAEEVSKNLSRIGYRFEHLGKDNLPIEVYEEKMNTLSEAPIFLFVTDNFLKSKVCMQNALDLLQKKEIKNRIIPIIADGIQKDKDSGIVKMVPTKFEKVSNVIQYMNFWQDEYLNLRKEKRKLEGEALDKINVELQLVRRISSETTEFLRMLRGLDYLSYEDLKSNFYELFFKRTGTYEKYPEYRQLPHLAVSALAISTGTTSSNHQEVVLEESIEEVATETDISNIPGIGLLTDKSKDQALPVIDTIEKKIENEVEPIVEAPTAIVEDLKETISTEIEEVADTEIEVVDSEANQNIENNTAAESIESLIEETIETEEVAVEADQTEEITKPELVVEEKPTVEGKLLERIVEMREAPKESKESLEVADVEDTPGVIITEEEITIPVSDIEDFSVNAHDESIDDLFDDEQTEDQIFDDVVEAIDDNPSEHLSAVMDDKVEVIPSKTEEDIMDAFFEDEPVAEPVIISSLIGVEKEIVTETTVKTEEPLSSIVDNKVLETTEVESTEPVVEEPLEKPLEAIIEAEESITTPEEVEENNIEAIVPTTNKVIDQEILEDIIGSEEVDKEVEAVQKIYDEVYNQRQINEWVEQEEYGQALEMLKGSNTVDANMKTAEIAQLQKDYFTAKTAYEAALVIAPKNVEVHYHLGNLLINHFDNQHDQALHHLEKVIGSEMEDEHILYDYAVILNERLNQPKASVEHFKKVLDLNPKHPFANYDLAVIYFGLDKSKKAAKYYLKAVEINNDLKTSENDEAFQIEKYLKDKSEQVASSEEKEAVNYIDNVVLITGATSGIGRSTAKILAKKGYNLILTGRRDKKLKTIKEEFEDQYSIKVNTLNFDVRDYKACEKAIESLSSEWSKIKFLINNAGLAKGLEPIHEGKVEDWNEMIDTNLKGLLYMTRLVSPFMVENKEGHIINVISIAGKYVYPNGSVYCATKHAVDALNRGMRMDLFKHNIRVSGISPGHVEETEFSLTRFEGNEEKAAAVYQDFQPLKAKDIAESIYFILSRPKHVNIEDIVIWGTQQGAATLLNRSGRD